MHHFKFFLGPPDEMSGLADNVRCEFCGSTGAGFELGSAICALSDSDKGRKHGCAKCLSDGRFEFWHDTDIGFLDEHGLKHVYEHNAPAPPDFSSEALIELRRTPQIVTWQQELWLSHCGDFMAYVGTWEPGEFARNSADGDGRTLFLKMTRDPDLQFLWDECLNDGESVPSSWNVTYYVFKCLHCGDLAGHWDCD